ncbi:MAG: hypothetical protein LBH96_03985 [Candidatus Peribacteria bacterium]|jgi:hypothetical protein|nr:hypothetical protein [Candidatus Peribacteria bacterium]
MRYLDGKNLEGKQYLKDHPNTLPEIKPKSYTKEQFVEYDSPLCLQDFFDLFEQNKMYRLFIYVFLRYLHKNSALYQQMKNAYKSRQETELD